MHLRVAGEPFRSLKPFFYTSCRSLQGSRLEGWWVKDHKPNKYPVTVDQRAAAAAKYGLRPEDYKSLPDLYNAGNYPDLGTLRYGHKDPWENWSIDRFRRNFGEPVPYMFAAWTPDRDDTTDTEMFNWKQSVAMFIVFYSFAFYFLYKIAHFELRYFTPTMSKQYPFDIDKAYPLNDPRLFKKTHYLFEEPDSGHGGHSHAKHH